MGCQVEIAGKIVAHGAGFVLALKGNHPSFEAAVKSYFYSAPPEELATRSVVEKGHGRIETRIASASNVVDWIKGAKSDPHQPRFPNIKTLLRMVNRTEYKDKCTTGTRYFISSAPLDIDRLADAVRGHWGVESIHWLLDVAFHDDLPRYRSGHGSKNMATLRRFALGLVRANKTEGSVKTRRKSAGWNPHFLLEILQIK